MICDPLIARDELRPEDGGRRVHDPIDRVSGKRVGDAARLDSDFGCQWIRLHTLHGQGSADPGIHPSIEANTAAALESRKLVATHGRKNHASRGFDGTCCATGQTAVLVAPPEEGVRIDNDHGNWGSQSSWNGAMSSSSETR